MRKKAIMCIILILAIALPMGTAYASDELSPWAAGEVTEAIAAGLVPDDLQSDYQSGISRLDYCRLAIALLEACTGEPIDAMISTHKAKVNPDAFSDTDNAAVFAANALGIVSGVGNGKFAPERGINRAEAATMLMRTANLVGDFKGLPYVFDDARHIPAWARESVYAARETGVMLGTALNEFLPNASYTREAAILTTLRMSKVFKGEAIADPNLFPMCEDVGNERLWGYVDKIGRFVIEPKYSYVSEWNDGYGIVSTPEEPNQCFVINFTGERVGDEHRYAGDFPFNNSDQPSVRFYGNYLHVLYGGRDIQVTSFSEGMLGTWLQDTQAYSNRNGEAFDFMYWGGAFFDGVAVTYGPNDYKYRVIDKSGNTLYAYDLDAIKDIVISGSGGQVGDLLVTSKAVKRGNIKEMYAVIDDNGDWHYKLGVIRADGTVVLPPEYELVRLTPFKQILASKNGEPYTLYNPDGKPVYKFPGYITGALHYDGIGNYLFRASATECITLSVSGEVLAVIPLSPEATIEFISGLVCVVDNNGCRYYDVAGKMTIGLGAV